MTSPDSDQPALFLAMPTAEGLDGLGVTFDGSVEVMRRLRHPFAVNPAGQTRQPTTAMDDTSEQRD